MHRHSPRSLFCALQKAVRQEVLRNFRLPETDAKVASSTPDALNALIVEHLKASKLHFTLAVFQREAACKHTVRDTQQLLSMLRISTGTQLHSTITGGPAEHADLLHLLVPTCMHLCRIVPIFLRGLIVLLIAATDLSGCCECRKDRIG